MAITNHKRGVVLLIAVIFVAVILAIGLGLTSLAYKQTVLASAATQAQYAFYTADAALECALYVDQQDTPSFFDYSNGALPPKTLNCGDSGGQVSNQTLAYDSTQWVVTYRLRFDSNKHCADITVYKPQDPVTGTTYIFSLGYNVSCDQIASGNAIVRGLSASY